jgi:hypothetical protein
MEANGHWTRGNGFAQGNYSGLTNLYRGERAEEELFDGKTSEAYTEPEIQGKAVMICGSLKVQERELSAGKCRVAHNPKPLNFVRTRAV